jgi:hypothetical protein
LQIDDDEFKNMSIDRKCVGKIAALRTAPVNQLNFRYVNHGFNLKKYLELLGLWTLSIVRILIN